MIAEYSLRTSFACLTSKLSSVSPCLLVEIRPPWCDTVKTSQDKGSCLPILDATDVHASMVASPENTILRGPHRKEMIALLVLGLLGPASSARWLSRKVG